MAVVDGEFAATVFDVDLDEALPRPGVMPGIILLRLHRGRMTRSSIVRFLTLSMSQS